jgi:hypothetical protein
MHPFCLLLVWLASMLLCTCHASAVHMLVCYCPTESGSPMGAVVAVNLSTGALAVVSRFAFPAEALPECPHPPNQYAPPTWFVGLDGTDVWLNFPQTRYMLHVDLATGELLLDSFASPYWFIAGFIDAHGGGGAVGTIHGARQCDPPDPIQCKYGCTCYTHLDLGYGNHGTEGAIIAMQQYVTDVALPDRTTGTVWLQGGMGDDNATRCVFSAGWCNYALDIDTGVLKERVVDLAPQYAAHAYAPSALVGIEQMAFAQVCLALCVCMCVCVHVCIDMCRTVCEPSLFTPTDARLRADGVGIRLRLRCR